MAQKPYKYDFCDIPNNEEGKLFRKLLNKYINKDKYHRIDTKGQKLKEGRRWQDFPYGYPVKESQTVRVYLRRNQDSKDRINYSTGFFQGREQGRKQALQDICSKILSELEN